MIIQAFGYTHEYLVQEVLNELLLERSRRKEPMKIGSEQLGDKVSRKAQGKRVDRKDKVNLICLHIL